ncbi:MAG: SSU ribosomal protein S18p @ SSU ribosomal protein S18p, zinc-dependent, partial [uncultured Truepera sp.]
WLKPDPQIHVTKTSATVTTAVVVAGAVGPRFARSAPANKKSPPIETAGCCAALSRTPLRFCRGVEPGYVPSTSVGLLRPSSRRAFSPLSRSPKSWFAS